jgi:hypothetical protein
VISGERRAASMPAIHARQQEAQENQAPFLQCGHAGQHAADASAATSTSTAADTKAEVGGIALRRHRLRQTGPFSCRTRQRPRFRADLQRPCPAAVFGRAFHSCVQAGIGDRRLRVVPPLAWLTESIQS